MYLIYHPFCIGIIHSVKDNTFYANILIRDMTYIDEEGIEEAPVFEIDARPSDSLILAVKRNIPVYVSSEIVNEHSIEIEEQEEEKDEDEKFKQFIENLDIDVFRRMLDERGEDEQD